MKTPGQVAYEAWWRNYSRGLTENNWSDQSSDLQAAWEAAARAVHGAGEFDVKDKVAKFLNGTSTVEELAADFGLFSFRLEGTKIDRLTAERDAALAMLERVTAYFEREYLDARKHLERFGHMDEYQRIMHEQSNLITAARRLLGKEINEQR